MTFVHNNLPLHEEIQTRAKFHGDICENVTLIIT